MSHTKAHASKKSRPDNRTTPKATSVVSSEHPLDALPDEAVRQILSFARPCAECHQWEWIDKISLLNRQFKRLAQSLAPCKLELTHFQYYLSEFNGGPLRDLRCAILTALVTSEWKKLNLIDFHVRFVFRDYDLCDYETWDAIDDDATPAISACLKRLLSTANALPKLNWLDVNILLTVEGPPPFRGLDPRYHHSFIDSDVLLALPFAVPKLTKLCLVGCFSNDDSSPLVFQRFAHCLQSPLKSLSLGGIYWLTDEHMVAILPVIGGQLERLELFEWWEDDYRGIIGDTTMDAISQNCEKLETLAIAGRGCIITSSGLEKVLKKNNGIRSLDVSDCSRLGQDTALVIASHAPFLETLRSYDGRCWIGWRTRSLWMTDQAIKTIVDGQLVHQKQVLQRIGVTLRRSNVGRMARGLCYAVERGLGCIEIDPYEKKGLMDSGLDKYKAVITVVDAPFPYFVSGSLYIRIPTNPFE